MRKVLCALANRSAFAFAMAVAVAWTGFSETVANVRGVQRPNSKLVDIYYDLNATDGGTYTVEVVIEGRTDAVTATTFSGDVGEGIAPGKNYNIVWEAGTDWPNKKGDVKAVVMATKEGPSISLGKVQLWEGGPYWADRNIGADNPWDYGLYFWWGDTMGHRASGVTFGFSFNGLHHPRKMGTWGKYRDQLRSEGWITSNGVLAPSHDAAHVKWGGNWRMPTYNELSALISKCDWTWTTMNGVKGYVVRGRGAYTSNSIFLPCAGFGGNTSLYNSGSVGYYSASSVPSSDSSKTWLLIFNSSDCDMECKFMYRYLGSSVRAVQ